MKKTLFILIIASVLCLNANADSPIRLAIEKARQFALEKNIRIDIPSEDDLSPAPYHIFNAKDYGGFVIVSSVNHTGIVLGYSDTGNIDPDNMPENLRWWLGCYERSLQYASHSTSIAKAPSERHTVQPLMKTKWGQGIPYNSKCPYIGESQCVTGCVATAMAQIMKYYNYPESSKEIYPYRTKTKIQMPALPAVSFNFDAMLNDYDNNSSEESKEAVSTLMLYCGCAITMNYDIGGSGADVTPVCDAMPYYFDYDDTSRKIYRKNYDTETWDQEIYNCIERGIPVFYSGFPKNEDEGHAFVCDGYDKGFFHINWGWNGWCDGFFKLSVLDPYLDNYDDTDTGNGFFDQQMAVVDLKPKNFTEPDTGIKLSKTEPENSKVYSISGMLMNNNPPKGLYIINNKKIIQKHIVL